MSGHYPEYFDDRRTSCSIDFAVGLLLGRRRFDGHYRNPNPALAPGEAFELLLELLDRSIFEELDDDLCDIEMELEDAKDAVAAHQGIVNKNTKGKKSKSVSASLTQEAQFLQQKVDDCKQKRLECESTIALATKYLRQIGDALANKVAPILREDTQATLTHGGGQYVTLTSLESWIDKTFPKGFRKDLERGASPVIEEPYDRTEDQCNVNGVMSKRGRDSLYLTLGVLIHLYAELAREASALADSQPKAIVKNDYKDPYQYINAAKMCVDKNGDLINLKLAKHLETSAKPYGSRAAIRGQAWEMQLNRIEEASAKRAEKLGAPRPTEAAAKIT